MKIVKKIAILLMWTVIIAGSVFLFVFSKNNNSNRQCKSVSINIINNSQDNLITTNELDSIIRNKYGEISKKKINNINTVGIQDYLGGIPYLFETQAQMSVDGQINIKTKQRTPLTRIITSTGKQRYIADDGTIMPVSNKHACRVVVASGDFDAPIKYGENIFNRKNDSSSKDLETLQKIFHVAKKIDGDEISRILIEQIYINNKNIELVSKAGRHLIIFGDTTNTEEKLENLKLFYQKGLTKAGWDKYSIINLQFKNQVVCN